MQAFFSFPLQEDENGWVRHIFIHLIFFTLFSCQCIFSSSLSLSSTSLFTTLSSFLHTAPPPPPSVKPILLLLSLVHLLPCPVRLITLLACALHFSHGSRADLWPPTEQSSTWLTAVSYFLLQTLITDLVQFWTRPLCKAVWRSAGDRIHWLNPSAWSALVLFFFLYGP